MQMKRIKPNIAEKHLNMWQAAAQSSGLTGREKKWRFTSDTRTLLVISNASFACTCYIFCDHL